eukprot:gene2528-5478_t
MRRYLDALRASLALRSMISSGCTMTDKDIKRDDVISSGCTMTDKDVKRADAYREMVHALTKDIGEPPRTPRQSHSGDVAPEGQVTGQGLRRTNLIRVDVDFELKPKSFSFAKLINNKIGRQAHIEFIENDVYARFLIWGVIRRYKLIQDAEPEHTWI